jgi:TonB family protein
VRTTWWLVLLALALQPEKPSMFVSEYTSRDQFKFAEGVLDVRGGGGWLRTPRVYTDYRLSLEYRAMTPDAEMTIVLRALTSRNQIFEPAYRVKLPLADPPSGALRSTNDEVRLVNEGHVQPIAGDGAWQRLDISAHLDEIRITLNDTLVGVYRVASFGGYILFTSKRGHLQMRNVGVGEIDTAFTTPAGTLSYAGVIAAGGMAPRLIKELKPFYTIETLHERKVAGVVALEVVVLTDGSVGAVRITKSLDPDLDQSAVATIRRWKFAPATLKGSPVPVLVEVEMSFAITR